MPPRLQNPDPRNQESTGTRIAIVGKRNESVIVIGTVAVAVLMRKSRIRQAGTANTSPMTRPRTPGQAKEIQEGKIAKSGVTKRNCETRKTSLF